MSTETLIDYRILGRNIKDARERLGKTQAAIAEEMQSSHPRMGSSNVEH